MCIRDSGYTAYTRPGRYDFYDILPTDGTEEDGGRPKGVLVKINTKTGETKVLMLSLIHI